MSSESVFQPLDEKAAALAHRLVHSAGFAALATIEPGSGQPLATRVAMASSVHGVPILLMSTLSAHTQALLADPRASLLCGEPGAGEPLTYPRISLIGTLRLLGASDPEYASARSAYLGRHPKATLYEDFGDFGFWVMDLERASMNAGFGRAYVFSRSDLSSALSASPA